MVAFRSLLCALTLFSSLVFAQDASDADVPRQKHDYQV